MIRQKIHLPSYNWDIIIFYEVSASDAYKIIALMEHLGADETTLIAAEKNLTSGRMNNGLTWSSREQRISIMVIGRTTTAREFWDTFDHEKGHVAVHIARANGIDPDGERRQYLSGEIANEAYPVARHFICDRCVS